MGWPKYCPSSLSTMICLLVSSEISKKTVSELCNEELDKRNSKIELKIVMMLICFNGNLISDIVTLIKC